MTHTNIPVLLDVQPNGVATITFNRPKALNALNEELVDLLEDSFYEAVDRPDVKVIAFMGVGSAFVAGADIKFFIKNIKDETFSNILAFTRRTNKLFLAIERSKKLTAAVLNGFSLGGGSELALACQTIISTPKGSLGFPETAIGIYPGLGGMLRLARKIGPALAKYYIFTGETILFEDAFNLGLFEKIVAEEELYLALEDLAKSGTMINSRQLKLSENQKKIEKLFSGDNLMVKIQMIKERKDGDALIEKTLKTIEKNAPLAVKLANEIIDMQVGKPIDEALEIESNRIVKIFSTKDALEGLTSIGKNKPVFKGE